MVDSGQITAANTAGYALYALIKAYLLFQLERELVEDDGVDTVKLDDGFYANRYRGRRITIAWDSRQDNWATVEAEEDNVGEGVDVETDSLQWVTENTYNYLVWELVVTVGKKSLSLLKYIRKVWNWSASDEDLGPGREVESEKVADMSKVWGWRSEGVSEIDNYTSKWLSLLLPQWHSGLGGPR